MAPPPRRSDSASPGGSARLARERHGARVDLRELLAVGVELDLGAYVELGGGRADRREVEGELAFAGRRHRELAILALAGGLECERDLSARAGELDELERRRLLDGEVAAG